MDDVEINLLEQKLINCRDTADSDIDNIEDILNINIDIEKSSVERILDFLVRSKNPYLFKVAGVKVRFEFSNNSNLSATDCISRAIKNEYIN